MLKQRVITAVLLLAVLLPVLLLDAVWPFALLTLALIGAAGWEWARLNGWIGARACFLGGVVAVAGATAWLLGGTNWGQPLLWWAALAAWVLGGSAVLARGVLGWPQCPRVGRLVLGMLMLWLGWLAMAQAKAQGLNFLMSVFVLVWVADIGAYFGGRAFGRRKLALAISPGKSWEGVWSGMVCVLLIAVMWIACERSFGGAASSLYSRLLTSLGVVGAIVALLFLAALSVVGDLFESLVKRSAGAKDSSGLLPGHGGVLDRIDALLPVFPAALALASLHGG